MVKSLAAIWLICIVISILSLVFYRSKMVHGPDAVGREIFAFALPIILALCGAVAIDVSNHSVAMSALTVAIAVIEAAVYFYIIMR